MESLATHRLFLPSGLRLAEKWGAVAVAAQARREMAEKGIAEPDLAGLVRMGELGVADFSNGFALGRVRW